MTAFAGSLNAQPPTLNSFSPSSWLKLFEDGTTSKSVKIGFPIVRVIRVFRGPPRPADQIAPPLFAITNRGMKPLLHFDPNPKL